MDSSLNTRDQPAKTMDSVQERVSGVSCERTIAARINGKCETCYDVWFGDDGADKKRDGWS